MNALFELPLVGVFSVVEHDVRLRGGVVEITLGGKLPAIDSAVTAVQGLIELSHSLRRLKYLHWLVE